MRRFLLWLLLTWALPLYGADQARSAHTTATLLSDAASIQPGQRFLIALRLQIDKGWHTYWQNPGDSGLATRIEWEMPAGFTAGPLLWPAPERIIVPPLTTYGYEGEVFLLTEITAPPLLPEGSEVSLRASIEWLECKEECLPGLAALELTLPVEASSAPSSFVEQLSKARSLLPLPTADWTLRATRTDTQIQLYLRPPAKESLSEIELFPLQTGVIEGTAPQALQKVGDEYQLTLTRVKGEAPPSLRGVLVHPGGWRGPGSERALAIDLPLEVAAAALLNEPAPISMSVWWSLVLAFIGGLLLNLMPCVLPVLSIKVLGFVSHAGQARAWLHGVVFTLGVLLSFWVLAGVLLALRAGGEGLGWGFQLQSPSFLIVLCGVIFLFGLSLFGVFEVGTSLTQAGALTSGSGLRGSFGSGVLATVVATPCTAPFMGAALGFAMTQPSWVAMLIFTSLGLGMSAPYLLLSAVPALRRRVPKPGDWMESFKQFMGFLMMGTVVWLLWVLGQQTDIDGVTLVLAFLVVLSMAGWIMGRFGAISRSTRSRVISYLLAAVLSLGGLWLVLSWVQPASMPKAHAQEAQGIRWEAFSEAKVRALQSEGRPVFIDFTAAWCLSCQVNERVVFGSTEVQDALERHKVAMLKADWTTRDEEITKALARFGRSGVPLYVLYGKTPNQAPKILPELITPGMVLAALEELK